MSKDGVKDSGSHGLVSLRKPKYRLGVAVILAERGEINLIQLNYQEAAAHFKAASERVFSHSPAKGEYLSRYANALLRYSEQENDNAALRQAINPYQQEVLSIFTASKCRWNGPGPQITLGLAHTILGERGRGTVR